MSLGAKIRTCGAEDVEQRDNILAGQARSEHVVPKAPEIHIISELGVEIRRQNCSSKQLVG